MGTPLYMAPEQATGGTLDGRADEYALAVVAFELLAGRVPFLADSPLAVLHQQVTAPPPPLSTVLPGSPAAADAVLAKALAKKAEERYATCGAFVRALGDALGVPSAAATVPASAPAPEDAGSQLRTVVSRDFGAPPLAAPASAPGPVVDPTKRTKWAIAAILLLSAGGGAWMLLRARPSAPGGAEAKATPEIQISSSAEEGTPATAAATPSTNAATTSSPEISDSSKVNGASAAAPGTAVAEVGPTPSSPFKEKSEKSEKSRILKDLRVRSQDLSLPSSPAPGSPATRSSRRRGRRSTRTAARGSRARTS